MVFIKEKSFTEDKPRLSPRLSVGDIKNIFSEKDGL